MSLESLPVTSVAGNSIIMQASSWFKPILRWLFTTGHVLFCENLPFEVVVVTPKGNSAASSTRFTKLWYVQRFFVKLWLPWVVEADSLVYLWYKARCRSFCYVACGRELLECEWRWPTCTTKSAPPRFADRVIVARMICDGSSTEVTELVQAFQGPGYDFHGASMPVGCWFPMMGEQDQLYVITAANHTLKFGKAAVLHVHKPAESSTKKEL
jgi:hypothetical protein